MMMGYTEKVMELFCKPKFIGEIKDYSGKGKVGNAKCGDVMEGYIKVDTSKKARREEDIEGIPGARVRRFLVGRLLVQIGMYIFIVGLLLILYRTIDIDMFSIIEESGAQSFQNPIAKELVGRSQMQRLRAALEVYYLEEGKYPENLEQLVQAKLVDDKELNFPWRNPHVYRLQEDGYVLLRPLE